jgi:hypothetical protein
MPPSNVPDTLFVPDSDTLPAEDGHVVVGLPPPPPPVEVGVGVGLPPPPVEVGVGFEPPAA